MDYSSFSQRPMASGVTLDGEPPAIELRVPSTEPVATYDNGEELVDAGRDLLCLGCYHVMGWPGTSPTTYLRLGIVTRLLEIQMELPDGFGLAIFDGWRSIDTVRALYAHYYGPGSTLEPGYLAEPDDDVTPPHLTGGAVDLTLTWQGVPLELGSPFDEFTPRSHLLALERTDLTPEQQLDRDLRRLLHTVMTDGGFAPYADEWWHYSLGDEAWAHHANARATLYGGTAPSR